MTDFELIEINRNNFLNKLISFKDKQLIKVISGVRRCGKSTLMQQFIKYLFTLGIKEEQIIFPMVSDNVDRRMYVDSFSKMLDVYHILKKDSIERHISNELLYRQRMATYYMYNMQSYWEYFYPFEQEKSDKL